MTVVAVKDLLQIDAFDGARVVAGQQGLDNPVRAVTIDEVPDGFRFLRGGELVLTSFYAPSRAQADARLAETMSRYVDRRVAAVAFKPGRFVATVPDSVVGMAEAAGLPLIALPADLAWPDLVLPVAQHLFLSQAEALTGAVDLRTLVERLAHFLARPVLLESRGLRVLAASSSFSDRHHGTSLDWWMERGDPKEWGRETTVRVVNWRGYWRQMIPVGGDPPLAWLTVIHDAPVAATPSPLARQATLAAAALMARQQAIDLAGGGTALKWLAELMTRGRPAADYSRVYVLAATPAVLSDRVDQLALAIVRWARECGLELAVVRREGRILVLAPAEPSPGAGDPVAEGLRRLLEDRFRDFRVAAGRVCSHCQQWPQSLADALHQLEAATQAAADADFESLVTQHVPNHAVRAWVERWLGPLREYDRRHGSELMLTLSVFFECRGHVGQTARRLSVHRNTVLYRLSQVRKLTGLDVTDSDQGLTVRIALALSRRLLS